MIKFHKISSFLLTFIIISSQTKAMSNPASKYCIDNGGTIRIISDDAGNQKAMCIFLDGSECEEWAFYNNTCGIDNNFNIKTSVNNMHKFINFASDYLSSNYENPGILQSVSFRSFSNMKLYNMTTQNCRVLFKDENIYNPDLNKEHLEENNYTLISIRCSTNQITKPSEETTPAE